MLYKTAALALLVFSCKTKNTIIAQPSNNIQLNPTETIDTKIADIIRPYTLGMDAAMNTIIGHSPAYLEKKKPSSALGSFMADATMDTALALYPQSTLCILNYGGIRSTLDSGAITIGEIYQLMPFENEIVILKLPITYIDTLKEFIRAKGGEPMSNNSADVGYLIANEDDYFYLVTNDYMANGGDDYDFLTKAEERYETGIKIRDALIGYVKKYKNVPIDPTDREL